MIPVPEGTGGSTHEFLFYYGAADKHIGVARGTLPSPLEPVASAQTQPQTPPQLAPQIDYHQHLLVPTDKSPQGFLASDLVKLLDDAHIPRALVLSMAYRYGNPNQSPVAD